MVHVLVAVVDRGKVERMEFDRFIREVDNDTKAIFAGLFALRHQCPVVFQMPGGSYGTSAMILPDDPQRYEQTFRDIAAGGSPEVDDFRLNYDGATGESEMPVWRVPVTFAIPAHASVLIAAKNSADAENIFNTELYRCKGLTPEELYHDTFFDLVWSAAQEDTDSHGYDYLTELEGHAVTVGLENEPPIPSSVDHNRCGLDQTIYWEE